MAQQVAVFLENQPGRLRRVTSILKQRDINIRAMTLTSTTLGWGVVNLMVNAPREAAAALQDAGFSAALREAIVVEIRDQPGGLDEMLARLEAAGLNLENAYARVVEEGKSAFLVIDVEDVDTAREKLTAEGIPILPDETVYGNQ